MYVDAGMEDKKGEFVGNVELEDMVLPNFGNAIFWVATWLELFLEHLQEAAIMASIAEL